MLVQRGDLACCVRCAGPTAAGRLGRRHLLKAAVHPLAADSSTRAGAAAPQVAVATGTGGGAGGGVARAAGRAGHPGVLTGTVLDTSPQIVTLYCPEGERRIALPPGPACGKAAGSIPLPWRPGTAS